MTVEAVHVRGIDNVEVELTVVRDPSDDVVSEWQEQWVNFVRDLEIGRGEANDWDWRSKAALVEDILAQRLFAVVEMERCHGLMLLSWPSRSRLRDAHVVYIEYLEVAPWNRRDLVANAALYRGVGKQLLRIATGESRQEGYQGRLNLHSLDEARPFYRRLGMHMCGAEECGAETPLELFEFDEDGVHAFLDQKE